MPNTEARHTQPHGFTETRRMKTEIASLVTLLPSGSLETDDYTPGHSNPLVRDIAQSVFDSFPKEENFLLVYKREKLGNDVQELSKEEAKEGLIICISPDSDQNRKFDFSDAYSFVGNAALEHRGKGYDIVREHTQYKDGKLDDPEFIEFSFSSSQEPEPEVDLHVRIFFNPGEATFPKLGLLFSGNISRKPNYHTQTEEPRGVPVDDGFFYFGPDVPHTDE